MKLLKWDGISSGWWWRRLLLMGFCHSLGLLLHSELPFKPPTEVGAGFWATWSQCGRRGLSSLLRNGSQFGTMLVEWWCSPKSTNDPSHWTATGRTWRLRRATRALWRRLDISHPDVPLVLPASRGAVCRACTNPPTLEGDWGGMSRCFHHTDSGFP